MRLRSRSPLRRRGPNPCWYGASCTRRSCRFVHPARSSHPRPHESRSKARESRSKGGSRRKAGLVPDDGQNDKGHIRTNVGCLMGSEPQASRNSKPQWLPPPPPPASGWPAATSERARWGRGEAEWSDRKWGRPEELIEWRMLFVRFQGFPSFNGCVIGVALEGIQQETTLWGVPLFPTRNVPWVQVIPLVCPWALPRRPQARRPHSETSCCGMWRSGLTRKPKGGCSYTIS